MCLCISSNNIWFEITHGKTNIKNLVGVINEIERQRFGENFVLFSQTNQTLDMNSFGGTAPVFDYVIGI